MKKIFRPIENRLEEFFDSWDKTINPLQILFLIGLLLLAVVLASTISLIAFFLPLLPAILIPISLVIFFVFFILGFISIEAMA